MSSSIESTGAADPPPSGLIAPDEGVQTAQLRIDVGGGAATAAAGACAERTWREITVLPIEPTGSATT